ncbi:hypothetical protein PoB_004604300 [Plakobranchus ocellatus]|uniref:Reverse transcriptase domain-containing protein n=1 Tax=Plakobranchus ocellatus TaxID=259542 RepID=A0AAV4BIX8_9GAST|nr:hypothetical protein PoB_004604300 [Plakobranchus ocellatus]
MKVRQIYILAPYLSNTDENMKKATHEVAIEDKNIAERLDLTDRIETTAKKEAFITLKDHKPKFQNKPTCRLINPCKPELGKVSEQKISQIINEVKAKTDTHQWKNTAEVVAWFNNIKNKNAHSMFSFDICDFYPSISLELLNRSLDYTAMFTHISSEDRHIITHTKKTTLYKKGDSWRKLASDFDVTMGSFDGAETCELVGLYLLSQLKNLNIIVGLYRDDGLAVTTQSAREAESTKKKICKIFKDNGLNITIEANKKAVDFLDISFDLRTGTHLKHDFTNTIPPLGSPTK